MATEIKIMPTGDEDRAIATITMAFGNDPLVRWVFRDADRYLAFWPGFVRAFAGGAFENGTADSVDNCGGVALWLPPGVEADEEPIGAIALEAVDRRRPQQTGPSLWLGAAQPCTGALRS